MQTLNIIIFAVDRIGEVSMRCCFSRNSDNQNLDIWTVIWASILEIQ